VAETVEAEEGAAYGAAILAGVGVNTWSSVDEACESVVRVSENIAPDAEHSLILEQAYTTYQRMYPAMKSILN
jgi:xylulokinase